MDVQKKRPADEKNYTKTHFIFKICNIEFFLKKILWYKNVMQTSPFRKNIWKMFFNSAKEQSCKMGQKPLLLFCLVEPFLFIYPMGSQRLNHVLGTLRSHVLMMSPARSDKNQDSQILLYYILLDRKFYTK